MLRTRRRRLALLAASVLAPPTAAAVGLASSVDAATLFGVRRSSQENGAGQGASRQAMRLLNRASVIRVPWL